MPMAQHTYIELCKRDLWYVQIAGSAYIINLMTVIVQADWTWDERCHKSLSSASDDTQTGDMLALYVEDGCCPLFDSGCISSFPSRHRNSQYAICTGLYSLHFLLIMHCQMSSPDRHTKHRSAVNYAGVKQFLETRVLTLWIPGACAGDTCAAASALLASQWNG